MNKKAPAASGERGVKLLLVVDERLPQTLCPNRIDDLVLGVSYSLFSGIDSKIRSKHPFV